jgi:putative MFS transporter
MHQLLSNPPVLISICFLFSLCTGSLVQLLAPSQRRTTLLLWAVWFLGSVGLYGVLVYLPTVFDHKGLTAGNLYERYVSVCSFSFSLCLIRGCSVFLTGIGNIPGVFAAAFLVETRLGRRWTMVIFAAASAGLIFVLAPANTVAYMVTFVCVSKFFLLGLWAAICAYTPEAYPTTLRGVGGAAAGCAARIAGIVTPPINTALFGVSLWVAVGIWSLVLAATAVAAALLPLETRGLELRDVAVAEESPLLKSDAIVL